MLAEQDPAAFDVRIEALTRALEASTDADARRSARELVLLVLEFHRAGLRRLLEVVVDAAPGVRRRIGDDPLIAGLLALHELETFGWPLEADQHENKPNAGLIQIRRNAVTTAALPIASHGGKPSRCERCGAPLDDSHHHHVDVVSRRLSCSCRACWLVSAAQVGADGLRAVPDRYVRGPALRLTDDQWDALQVPVATAFFMFNSIAGRTIAFYPSPAGPTESALSLKAWRDVEDANPWMRAVAPDVEAVLVRKNPGSASYEAFIVPIDACYDLVGRIRLHWGGFDGGGAVRGEIERFFSDVAARSAGAATSMAPR